MHGDYKASKEAFVSGTTGSTVLHINAICSVGLSSIALHSALTSRVAVFRSMPFFVEWILLSVPLLLSMTVYAEAPGALSVLLSVATAVLLLLPPTENGAALPTKVDDGTTSVRDMGHRSEFQVPLPPLPALSTYRAHMMLMTVLSILAVDFRVFPRALAKCETYGVSLMDLGVGSFVFSQGIVSAIPLLKDPSRLRKPLGYKLFNTLKKVAPVAVLGLIRLMAVKGTDYPEHVTEYGVHWNFFMTLSLLPVFEVFTHGVILHIPIGLLGLWIGVVQQCLLSFAGLGDVLLNAPRSNIILANKEGLISLLGYFSIHIIGLSVGTIVLPPRPSFFRKHKALLNGGRSTRLDLIAPRQTAKVVAELFSCALVWWSSFAFARLKLDVSRGMVNLPYILWVSAFNTSFILGYCLLDMLFFPTRVSHVKDSSDPNGRRVMLDESSTGNRAPLLLEAINKNSLVIFLIANVATGLINLSVKTMYTSDGKAMLILGGYAYCLCAFAWIFRSRRLWRF
ncbi:GWT1-domain-containing protein [Pisolithus marmoratus]|nr:GWT1-domain-containing protein [Pisolithus marmoratus]